MYLPSWHHGKQHKLPWKCHGILLSDFCGNPVSKRGRYANAIDQSLAISHVGHHHQDPSSSRRLALMILHCSRSWADLTRSLFLIPVQYFMFVIHSILGLPPGINHFSITGRSSDPAHHDGSIRQAATAAFVTSSFKIVLTQTFPLCGATCYILSLRVMYQLFNGANFVYRSVEVYGIFRYYLRVLVRIRNFYNGGRY